MEGEVFQPLYTPYSKMATIFSIPLFTCKLAPVASFKEKYSFEFKFKNEATRTNLQVNKRTLKWQPFWNVKVYSSGTSRFCLTCTGICYLS